MDAPKIQISQLLSETTKDCDNIVITVLCLSVTKEIPCPTVLNESTHHLYARSLHRDFVSNFYFSKYHRHKYVFKNQISFWLCYTIKMQFYYKCSIHYPMISSLIATIKINLNIVLLTYFFCKIQSDSLSCRIQSFCFFAPKSFCSQHFYFFASTVWSR